MTPLVIFTALPLVFSSNTHDFIKNFDTWEINRAAFVAKMRPVNRCLTDKLGNDIMKVINSRQCSSIGLPLDDAIKIEYENWESEEWFPNEAELADMKIHKVM